MKTFIRQLRPAVMAVVVFTVLLGVVYPLVVTGDRPGGVQRQGQRLADQGRRRGRRQRADRSERSSPPSTSIPALGGRRRLRRVGQLRLEPRADEPRPARRGRGAGRRLPRGERAARRRSRAGRRRDRLGVRSRPGTSRSPTPGSRRPESPPNGASTSTRCWR